MVYRHLADLTAALHVAYVAFVVLALPVILVGRALRWRWVANRWFRSAHLGMILAVVARALVWSECPLTAWERSLRELAGQTDFEGSPAGRVLHALIHPDLPLWAFPTAYAVFALLVLGTLWLAPVRWCPGRPVRGPGERFRDWGTACSGRPSNPAPPGSREG
jgi:hypothetical protein